MCDVFGVCWKGICREPVAVGHAMLQQPNRIAAAQQDCTSPNSAHVWMSTFACSCAVVQ